jgi:hypothetical protein
LDFTAGGRRSLTWTGVLRERSAFSLRRLRLGLASLVVEGFVVAIGLGGFLASRRG